MSVRLVEESSPAAVPLQLENLARALCDSGAPIEVLHKELFVAVVVVLMLEKGFTPYVVGARGEVDESTQVMKLPEHWKRTDGSYEMKFSLKQFPTHPVRLVVTPLGAVMLVNAILVDLNNDVYSECLPLCLHVAAPLASTISGKYRNLAQLAAALKTKVLSPVRSRIIKYYGYESASLIGLPRELINEIFMYLKVREIMNIYQTCGEMQWIKTDNRLWRALLQRDYPKLKVCDHSDYLCKYVEEVSKANRSVRDTRMESISKLFHERNTRSTNEGFDCV